MTEAFKGDTKKSDKLITYFIAMNLTESKYYVYLENGVQVNRVNYGSWVEKMGEPLATSEDGQNFIFKKKRTAKISIIHMDEHGLTHIKNIDIHKEIWLHLGENAEDEYYKEFFQDNHWSRNKNDLQYKFRINNDLDVVVEIHQKTEEIPELISIKTK